jgi:uncharacterized protein YgfB (UPF0149 family)
VHLRVRVLAPFACSFARIGLQRWLAAERAGFGVELDVSLNGAKVMSPASMNMGDQLAISLCLPDQIATMKVDATVRWGNRHTLGVEVTTHTLNSLKPGCGNFSPVRHRHRRNPIL